MADTGRSGLRGVVVDDEATLTLVELSRAVQVGESHIELWVGEGVLQPSGGSREEWRFAGSSLRHVSAWRCA